MDMQQGIHYQYRQPGGERKKSMKKNKDNDYITDEEYAELLKARNKTTTKTVTIKNGDEVKQWTEPVTGPELDGEEKTMSSSVRDVFTGITDEEYKQLDKDTQEEKTEDDVKTYYPSDMIYMSPEWEDIRHAATKHDAVNHPAHYKLPGMDAEAIDVIRAVLGDEGFKAYCHGNVIKYVIRADNKGGVEDLRKARVYLDWEIEAAEPPKEDEE